MRSVQASSGFFASNCSPLERSASSAAGNKREVGTKRKRAPDADQPSSARKQAKLAGDRPKEASGPKPTPAVAADASDAQNDDSVVQKVQGQAKQKKEEDPGDRKLFVKNLPFTATGPEILAFFKGHGVKAVQCKLTNQKGCAVVQFQSPGHLAKALNLPPDTEMLGRVLFLQPFKKRAGAPLTYQQAPPEAPEHDKNKSVFVSNIPIACCTQDAFMTGEAIPFVQALRLCGNIVQVIPRSNRISAIVEFDSSDAATKAIGQVDGQEFEWPSDASAPKSKVLVKTCLEANPGKTSQRPKVRTTLVPARLSKKRKPMLKVGVSTSGSGKAEPAKEKQDSTSGDSSSHAISSSAQASSSGPKSNAFFASLFKK